MKSVIVVLGGVARRNYMGDHKEAAIKLSPVKDKLGLMASTSYCIGDGHGFFSNTASDLCSGRGE